MNKSFPINLNGKIFYIDEDAYELLDRYLTNLHITFSSTDDNEIVLDIEARIAELFSEKINDNKQGISIADVNNVIDTIGKPEDLADNEPDTEIHSDKPETDNTNSGDTSTPPPFQGTTQNTAPRPAKKLYRDIDNKVISGVLSGLSHYTDWDVSLLRFITLALAIIFLVSDFTFYHAAIKILIPIAYFIAAIAFPAAETAQQKLEMTGKEVNIENIGHSVKENVSAPGKSSLSVLGDVAGTIAKIMLIGICIFAAPIALAALTGIVGALIGLITVPLVGINALCEALPNMDFGNYPMASIGAVLAVSCAIIIPCIAVIYGASSVFRTQGKLSGKAFILMVILEALAIAASIITCNIAIAGYDNF